MTSRVVLVLVLSLGTGTSAQYHMGPSFASGGISGTTACGLFCDGLANLWHLDETTGSRLDAMGDDDLSDINTTGSAAGKRAGAAEFANGSTNSVRTAAANYVMPQSYTVAFWFYITDAQGGRSLAGANANSSTDIQFLMWFNGATSWTVSHLVADGAANTESKAVLDSGASMANGWHLCIAWFDYTEKVPHISIDNNTPDNEATGAALAGTPYRTPTYFSIGRAPVTFGSVSGRIDEFALWQGAHGAKPAWRAELYAGGAGKFYPS